MSTIGITVVPGKDVCDNRVHKVRLVPDKGETGVCQRKTCRTFSIRVPGKDVCDNRVHKVRLVPDIQTRERPGSARGKLVGCSQLLYVCL